MATLRLLTYNIHALRDDSAAVARVIRAAEPHVVCIQESPRFLRWRSSCAALARHSGLVVVTGGRTAAGNLIMSTLAVEVSATRDQLLSKDPGLHQRAVALTLLELGGVRFAVAGTHLDLEAEPRLRHVGELDAAIDDFVPAEVPVIVAGDINELPGQPSWNALSAHRRDAFAAVGVGDGFTYSASKPVRRIDGVFTDPRLPLVSAQVLAGADVEAASDHSPILVELELR